MRFLLSLGLSAVVLGAWVPVTRAQQGYFNRTSVARSPSPRDTRDAELTRYGRPSGGPAAKGEYRRSRPETPRAEPPPRPMTSRNYFPGMPSGVGPNRNMGSGSRPHCVPSRGSFFVGR